MINMIIERFVAGFNNNLSLSITLILLSACLTWFICWLRYRPWNSEHIANKNPLLIDPTNAVSPITYVKHQGDLSYKSAVDRHHFVMGPLFCSEPHNGIWSCGMWTSKQGLSFSQQIDVGPRKKIHRVIKSVLKRHYGCLCGFDINNVASHSREGWFVFTVWLKKANRFAYIGHELLTKEERRELREALQASHHHFVMISSRSSN